MATVFENRMVAHVWAQQSQESGRSNNGQFYFTGRTLYSYGSHFVAGYFLPPEVLAPGFSSRALALINDDSPSVTTSKHLSFTRQSVRAGMVTLGGLTDLARRLDHMATYGEADPRAKALELVTRHLENPTHGVSEQGAARLLSALGAKNAEGMAARIVAKRQKAEQAAKEQAAKDKADSALASGLRILAYQGPKGACPVHRFVAERVKRSGPTVAQGEVESMALTLFRGAKVAKARRQTARARDMLALRKEALALVPMLESMAEKGAVRRHWASLVRTLKEATPEHAAKGESYPLQCAVKAAETLATVSAMPAPYLAHVFRVLGIDPARMAQAMAARGDALDALQGNARKVRERQTQRALIGHIRGAKFELARALESVPTIELETRLTVLKEAESALWPVADQAPVNRYDSGRKGRVPAPFKVAGFTGAYFGELLARISEAKAATDSAVKAERAAAKVREQEQARADWRATGQGSYNLRCEEGGAMLRAVGVVRDDSGQVTGGTLRTSQGADVPLTHAIRAFRFLKLCRTRGQGWRANGKTLPVGHFRIEAIDSLGNFTAGCHRIFWREVETLAGALGLADLAPAETTEAREHA